MIRKTNKGGLFRKRKQRSVRKFIVLGLAVMLAGFGLSILVSEQIPSVNAGSSDNRATVAGIYSTGAGTETQTRALVKSISNRGSFSPALDMYSANLTVDGETKTYNFIGHATVDNLIEKSGVTLAEQDELSKRLDTAISPDDTIQIVRVTTDVVEERVETPFETEYIDDATMTKGTTLVMQEGSNKVVNNVYNVTYHDGVEVSRELDHTDVIQEGQNKKIAQGTKEEPVAQPEPTQTPTNTQSSQSTQSTPSSSTETSTESTQTETSTSDSSNTIAGYYYSNVITCTAFAYTAPAGACGASGKPAVEGTCAVDPSVIPMGTKLYIEGYGYAVANDTGGAIKGNTVDVFYDTYNECVNWGRRTVKVYILD